MPVGSLLIDGTGVVVSADRSALTTLGCDGSLVGRRLTDACDCPGSASAPARPSIPSPRVELAESPEQEEFWRRHDGTRVGVRVSCRPTRLTGGDGWLVTVSRSGVHGPRASPGALPGSPHALVDHASDVLAVLDDEGRILSINEAAEGVLGQPPTTLLQRRVWELFERAEGVRLRALLARLADDDDAPTPVVLTRELVPGGRERLEVFVRRSPEATGTLLRIRPHPADDQELVTDDAVAGLRADLRSTSAFVSALSHELRTPLNAVLGFAQLLELEPMPPAQAEAVARILESGRHMLTLVDDALDIAGLEADRFPVAVDAHDVGALCEQATGLLGEQAARSGARITVSSPQAVTALVDADRLVQVMLNLLANALKYGGPQARVSVAVEVVEQQCRISVRDRGPGVPPADRARVFEPFERLARDADLTGSGLGLPVARRLARRMGGDLVLAPGTGPGACFVVTVPRADAPRPAPPSWTVSHAVRGDLLYVEDCDSNVHLVERILQRRPRVSLDVVSSIGEARRRLAEKRYDAVLLDLHLPDGRGDELLELDVATTFVVLSGEPSGAGKGRGQAHLTLTKPLDVAAFLSTVDAVLSVPRARAGRPGPPPRQ